MKRLTLNETWEQCLKMWKWISRQCLGHTKLWCKSNVNRLKIEWFESNNLSGVHFHCFFCHSRTGGRTNGIDCGCPAHKVDKNFSCTTPEHHYMSHPRLFYAKLKELNKIRLSKGNKK
jgi:hypothetical protein